MKTLFLELHRQMLATANKACAVLPSDKDQLESIVNAAFLAGARATLEELNREGLQAVQRIEDMEQERRRYQAINRRSVMPDCKPGELIRFIIP